jgi:hypothetical protein
MKNGHLKKVSWKAAYLVWLGNPVSALYGLAIIYRQGVGWYITQGMRPIV